MTTTTLTTDHIPSPLSENKQIPSELRKRDLAWMLVIGLLGLTLRLLYVWQYSKHPHGRLLWVDEQSYFQAAERIMAGQWLPDRPFYQDPLISYILAGLMRIVGKDVVVLRYALACLGAMTPLIVFLAGRQGLGRPEGIVAGLATALYGPLIFTDGLLEKEGAGALVAALALWRTAKALVPNRRYLDAGLAGLLWGLLALLRSNALLVGILGPIWWVVGPGRPPSPRWRKAIVFFAAFVLPLVPVSLINLAVSKPREFILVTWQAGSNFYIGNRPGATGINTEPAFVNPTAQNESEGFVEEASRRSGRPLSLNEVSQFWLREGLRFWAEKPREAIRLLGRKFAYLMLDFEVPDSQSFALNRAIAWPSLALGFLTFGWLTPWATMGLSRTPRPPFWWFLALSTTIGLGSTALFFVLGRYRIPWTPGLALLAACGATDLARRIGRRRWLDVSWRILVLAVPTAALAWRADLHPARESWAQLELALFVSHVNAGQLDDAINNLDDLRALGRRPAMMASSVFAPGPVHDRLAAVVAQRLALAGEGRFESDLASARWARAIPEGRDVSRRLLEAAERARPGDPRVQKEWGGWWLGQFDHPDARIQALKHFQQTSNDPSAQITLALLTGNRQLLDLAEKSDVNVDMVRIRLARAILDAEAIDPVRPSTDRGTTQRPRPSRSR